MGGIIYFEWWESMIEREFKFMNGYDRIKGCFCR